MMTKIREFFLTYYDKIAQFISSVVNILISVLVSVYTEEIKQLLEIQTWTVILIGILFFLIWLPFQSFIVKIIKDRFLPELGEESNILHAFNAIRGIETKIQENLLGQTISNTALVDICKYNIEQIVTACYNLFNERYSECRGFANGIKFEVTFMTISYKDKKITIPFGCNRDNRQPISMQMRSANPNIYDGTVTAKIYAMDRPEAVLIPDTSSKKEQYAELYSSQKNRIKSTIVTPIMSPKNSLLGTLVVHCDKPRFFTKSKLNFWEELISIFTAEIGKEKILMDNLALLLDEDQLPF